MGQVTIGVMRHWQVDYTFPKYIDSDGLVKTLQCYNAARLTPCSSRFCSKHWDVCYTSDSYRALATTAKTYNGATVKTRLLREIPVRPFFFRGIKLPITLWRFLFRMAWLLNYKTPETKSQTQKRARMFLRKYCLANDSANILVITHGFYMLTLQRELIREGFAGKISKNPICGQIYVYKKMLPQKERYKCPAKFK
ncbi:MAG: histidine phosphatase family protein [Candidatus Woesearchaeota archaeon]